MDQSLMAQQFQQTAIDLDADGDSLLVVTAPAAPTATEITIRTSCQDLYAGTSVPGSLHGKLPLNVLAWEPIGSPCMES